ncbi:hypothetical protein H8K33_08670 [Undibacterium amnicola]|uniref:Replication-associated protein G2P N-terminal domain-containing protein n=1 Tax=Undibacterium amnicola TaxID=1834038 RepID=A0ABR6XQ34_9BURK|nr:phage/plasmid replication protein, II/X family [Undibacterium amnicola]MBC3831582.1 hypothetical protein [Undibacterium amnicola]
MNNDKKNLKHIADCIMVDTLGLRVKNVHGAKLPKTFSRVSDDPQFAASTEWSKASIKAVSGKLSLRVRGIKKSGDLLVEGSNGFHYQGHNIVSSNDVTMSAFSMLHALKEQHELEIDKFRQRNFIQGDDIEITRIDTPIMLKIPDGLQKSSIINALAFAGFRSGVNTSVYIDETVYFDQSSQDVSLKAYDKTSEMQKKRPKIQLSTTTNTPTLLQLSENTIRFEAVYRKKYFKNDPFFKQHEMVTPVMLTPPVLAAMLMELFEKYDLRCSLRQRLREEDLWRIRSPYRTTVALWQSGVSLLKMFDNKITLLQKHQRIIKNDYGINISAPPPGEIYVPIELGEILAIENFVPVPAAIRSDPVLFYERDMRTEWKQICGELGFTRGIGATYISADQTTDVEEYRAMRKPRGIY